ncbi:MAG: CapA family protein [Bryobacteraceae bacterium]|jgi:poly-gamma-glutamate synthesis protein (capsule biosynthesis protein)
MPRAQPLLIAGCLLAATAGAWDGDGELRLLFTGDILLSREVRREIDRTGRFPWEGFMGLFRQASWVAGNLEGAVGPAQDCLPGNSASPCFAIAPNLIPLLAQAGFRALGMANNHALDLGAPGRDATRKALREAGLEALSYEDSPVFLRLGAHTVAILALSIVPDRQGARVEVPSVPLRQKLRLARGLADLVVVYMHWGSELLEWPDTRQRQAAEWLIRNGADLIVGHHPHVVQAPECLLGHPVFYSLGNHLFDQKYPATKRGLIADCRVRDNVLRCGGVPTLTPAGSAFPELMSAGDSGAADALKACPVKLAPALAVNGYSLDARAIDGQSGYVIEGARAGVRPWRSPVLPLVSAEAGRLAGAEGPEFLFTLERHHSSIDGEDGVRPYVYEARPSGLVARWRGSALAWPLLDAALLPGSGGLLCALHRRDSFLALQPGAEGARTAAYRWNGFGFSGVEDPGVLARCRALLGSD